ncbi:MAG: hypothetical protein QOI47_628 [Actinomycetota bacterium]|nr:hypothetical protein [Actinomycetota bacterium]
MTSRRAARSLLVAACFAVGAIGLVPTTARALDGTAFTARGNTTTEADEPAIPGSDPASATASQPPDPPTCSLSPSCMSVPLTIEVPPKNPGDDFVVTLSFSWAQPSGTEDIDFWIYDDGQTAKAKGSTGYTVVGQSASAKMPEVVRLYDPEFGKYHIVANVFTGPNTGWHIKAVSQVGVFEKPFEALAPPPGGGSSGPEATTTTMPSTTPSASPTETTVTLPEGQVIPDKDFGAAFAPNNAFQDQLGSQRQAASALRNLGTAKASSPGAVSVLAWMLLLPAALVALGLLAFRARKGGLPFRRKAST